MRSPIPSSDWLDGLPSRLSHAHRLVRRQVDTAVEDLGVTVTQLAIAVHLDEFGHMSASDLARVFALTPQSTTVALNRLETIGWVRRVPNPAHRRVVWYEVTDVGLAASREGADRLADVSRRVDEMLVDVDRDALSSALSTISAELDARR